MGLNTEYSKLSIVYEFLADMQLDERPLILEGVLPLLATDLLCEDYGRPMVELALLYTPTD